MSHLLRDFLLVTALLIIVSLSHQNVLCRDCEGQSLYYKNCLQLNYDNYSSVYNVLLHS